MEEFAARNQEIPPVEYGALAWEESAARNQRDLQSRTRANSS
jgi:hypothetical protein